MELIQKLQPDIDRAIDLIRDSAKKKQVIFVRHHNDCDGYSAAIAMDDFIYNTILQGQTREREVFYHYKRLPCSAPFYTSEDASKDISYIYNGIAERNKNPLMIVIDNGSSKEDLEGLQKLKQFGFRIIVIDHHPPYDKIDKIVDVHINPYLISEKPVMSAGTLCCEIAKQIYPDKRSRYDFISCVSAISDHMEGKVFENAIKSISYDYGFLDSVSEAIDYELQQSGFIDPWTIVKELFLDEKGIRNDILETYTKQIKEKNKKSLDTSIRYAKTSTESNKVISFIDIASTNHKRDYPKMGKSVSLFHNHIEEKNPNKECITFGFTEDMVTVRASDNSKIDVNKLIEDLDKSFPYAKISGGGHPHAGSIRFIPLAKEDIIKEIKDLSTKQ